MLKSCLAVVLFDQLPYKQHWCYNYFDNYLMTCSFTGFEVTLISSSDLQVEYDKINHIMTTVWLRF